MPKGLPLAHARRYHRGLLVVSAIAVSLLITWSDAQQRHQRLTAAKQGLLSQPLPQIDRSSTTGYELGMRVLVPSFIGTDGCYWVMYAQQLLDQGGWRIRSTAIDNPPEGREVHWSHGFIWYLIGMGKVHASMTGLPCAASVEAVSPYANALLLVGLITGLPWLVYRPWGPWAASSLAIGLSCIYPFHDLFVVGNADHHGMTAASAFLCLLCLMMGGGGWVVGPLLDGSSSSPEKAGFEYRVDEKIARRYIAASAFWGAVSLWISAATAIPLLVGIGIAGLISAYFFGIRPRSDEPAYHPELWRRWGIFGGLSSLFFYLVEYFPWGVGMRLEVNHPLYAFAWWGGGEIVYRVTRWITLGILPWSGKHGWLVSAIAVLSLFMPILLVSCFAERFFWVADPFLWTFHRDHIREFSPFVKWLYQTLEMKEYYTAANFTLFPLLLLLAIRLIFIRHLGRSWRGLLLLGSIPMLVFLGMGMIQVRWLSASAAHLLALIPLMAGCIAQTPVAARLSAFEKAIGFTIATVVLMTFPLGSLSKSYRLFGKPVEVGFEEIWGIYIRDIAYALRRANPHRDVVLLSGPTSTTYLEYFSGAKGLGTLYWENLPGLKAAARLYAAVSMDEASTLVKRHGLTHFVIFKSNHFAHEYARLHRGPSEEIPPEEAFVAALLSGKAFPIWLKPYHVRAPSQLPDEQVFLAEVDFDQSEVKAHLAVGAYYEAKGERKDALSEYRAARTLDPNDREAAIRVGLLWLIEGGGEDARQLLEDMLRDQNPKQITELCGQWALKCFQHSQHQHAAYFLRKAIAVSPGEPAATNALAWLLATSFDDTVRNPAEAIELAKGNTSHPSKATYLDTLAACQAASGEFEEAIRSMKQALEILAAESAGSNHPSLDQLRLHLQSYQARKPVRTGQP